MDGDRRRASSLASSRSFSSCSFGCIASAWKKPSPSGRWRCWPSEPAFSHQSGGTRGDLPDVVAFLTATIASLVRLLRFGYLYAAFAGVICAAAAALNLGMSRTAARLLCRPVSCWWFSSSRARSADRTATDFAGDDYGAIEAVAWFGVYAILNLRLSFTLNLWVYRGWIDFPPAFYWATYAAIWILPRRALALASGTSIGT